MHHSDNSYAFLCKGIASWPAPCNTGLSQSPIDINTSTAQLVNLGKINFSKGYWQNIEGKYVNEGYSGTSAKI